MTETLSHHLARDRRHAIAEGAALPNVSEGAVLFADIAGFTGLTSSLLATLGDARGAEELTRVLETIYDALIAPVHAYGGCVVTFSGDAITCWFEAGDANRAGAAAMEMHSAVQALELNPGGHPLKIGVKVGIGYGTVFRLAPGDARWQRIDTLSGPPVLHAAEAERLAQVGETLLSASAAATLSSVGRVAPQVRGGYFVLQQATAPKLAFTQECEPDESKAAPFVLSSIRPSLSQGRARYLSEIRPVCAIFISFRGLEDAGHDVIEQRLDEFVRSVQFIFHGLEGVLIGVTIGDKGSYLNGSFGAPLAHEDDVARAVAAATEVLSLAQRFSWLRQLQIGISHGRMRAGTFGSPTRKTYAVLGEFSNKAARLMQWAKPGEILLDEGARQASENAVVVASHGELLFKGNSEAQPIHRYVSRRSLAGAKSDATPFFGRTEECAIFEGHLVCLAEGQASIVVVEGEAGVGKSRVVQAFGELARARQVAILTAHGDSLERSSPYHAWREVLAHALGYPEQKLGLGLAADHARKALPSHLDPELLPLLSPALRFSIADTKTTQQLRGEARADNTLTLVAEVLAAQIPEEGAVVIAEDSHWFDSASWGVLARLCALRPRVLVVVASRPVEADVPNPEYNRWRSADASNSTATRGHSLLQIRGLRAEQFNEVLASHVGAERIESSLSSTLYERTSGHPFFGQELVLSLMSENLLTIEDGELRLRDEKAHLEDVEFPATIEGVVRSRLDRLPPGADLVLKVAATLGVSFSLGAMLALHPGTRDEVNLALQTLARHQIVEPQGANTFSFRHAITRQVTYQQMLDDQRRDFHERAAGWYETQEDWDRNRKAPVLAHHWLAAGKPTKALEYLDRAAHLALEQGANREAIRFSAQATEAAGQSSNGAQRRAHLVGSAHMGLGEITQARLALETALALSNRPVPESPLGLGLAILGQLFTQTAHRLLPGMLKHDVLDAEERERAARTLTEVTPAYYLGNNISRMFYANLRSMNLTERALSRPLARGVVAECYATSALIASATGARRISDYYEELTRTILPRVEDPVSLGQAHMLFGLRYMGEGRCLQARTQAEQACQLFEAAGHRRRYEVAAGTKAFILGYLGDYDSAITQWTDIERLGRARQHPQSIGLSLHGLAECLLAKEDDRQIEHVRRSLAEASRAYPPGNDLMFDIQASALRGETELRMARLDEAREHFTRAVTLIETTVPLSAYAMSSYGRVAWGVHALLRKGAVPRTLAGRATKNLRQFGRAFRLAEPAALACQAMLAAHDGKTAKAQRLELKATALAASLQLPLLPTLARAP